MLTATLYQTNFIDVAWSKSNYLDVKHETHSQSTHRPLLTFVGERLSLSSLLESHDVTAAAEDDTRSMACGKNFITSSPENRAAFTSSLCPIKAASRHTYFRLYFLDSALSVFSRCFSKIGLHLSAPNVNIIRGNRRHDQFQSTLD